MKHILKGYTALILCLCFCMPVVFAETGNYSEFLKKDAETGFSFVPYDTTGILSGKNTAVSDTDMYFGLGTSYYTMSMSKGYANGMTMEADTKSGSLQDASNGAGFTAEVSFDISVDATAAYPLQIRFFPQDKSGTVHKGNSVTKMSLTPKADGTRLLTVYDRTGKTVLGEVNLTDVLGSYVSADGYFFRFRYVFQVTDENNAVIRNEKVYVDGKEVLSANYINNTKEYRIAGIGIQRSCESYGAIDNLVFSQYNGIRKDSTGKDMICDDALVAAVRKAAVLKSAAENDAYLTELEKAVSDAKAGYLTMQTQADCDFYVKELETAMKHYSDSLTMEQFVFSDFSKENALYITKDMTFPTSFLPADGGIYDCSVTADKPDVVAADGTVIRPKYNETVLLTANLTRDTDFSSMQKTFPVRVLADGTVVKLGDIKASLSKTYTPAKRVLLGGYTQDTPAEIFFGENSMTVSANCEFSAVCDYVSGECILYQNGEIVQTSVLNGSPAAYTVSGNVYDAVFIKNDSIGYKVQKLQFESPEGSPRTIPVSEGIVCGAEFICKNETLKDTKVYAAVYENNKLFSVSCAEISEKHSYNETFTASFSATLPQEIKDVVVKLLFVNNSHDFTPIIPAYSYIAKEEINFNPVIYIAGDSTACNYSDGHFPQTGWGQVLGNYFTDEVTVENYAKGGRSAKSFMDEGLLDTIFSQIQPGDYLLIQFGHNDQKVYSVDPYRDYLKIYINGARELGAVPILLTSVTRRTYKDGVFDNGKSLGKFPEAAREVAKEMNVPLIETFDYTVELVNTLGEEGSKDIFLHLTQNDERFINDPRFANSRYHQQETTADNSHFQYYGAEVIAGFIAKELDALQLSLSQYYKPYTPVKP